jgi:voltage-gated sodium channel
VRLLRVVRIVRVLPDLRVLLLGVWRSVLPLASIAAVTAMLLIVYGMVGWIWFGDELPDHWGDIGRAMLTLFVMLTLENFPNYMDAAMEVEPWAWLYFVSFIMIAAFIVLNVLIGIVLNSMEEARELERRRALRERYGVTGPSPIDPEAHAHVAERIAILRTALEDLELQLALGDVREPARRPDR